MDEGTGKITKSEMRGVRHHLLDVADPKKRFNAEKYRALARAAIDDIASRKKLPIICGGTGFYIDAILKENLFPSVPPDENLRKKLSKKSPADLLLILKKLDPKRAKVISKSNSERNNQRRIIRAIEIAYKDSPCTKSRTRRALVQNHVRDVISYKIIFIGIKPSIDDLKKRIRVRLLKRLKHGMIREAQRLHAHGLSWKRMDELGLEYRYMARFLQGKMSKEEFVEKLNTEIWHYGKRQMTWFKRNSKIRWFDLKQENKILSYTGELANSWLGPNHKIRGLDSCMAPTCVST
jgi:tRNA dimethylallyltransferase